MAAGLRFGPDAACVMDSADVEGKISAAVSGADLEPRMAVEHAAENQFRQRDGRIRRIADYVGEIVGRDSRTEGASRRMNKNEGVELLDLAPNRLQAWVGQFEIVDGAAHNNAFQAQGLNGVI